MEIVIAVAVIWKIEAVNYDVNALLIFSGIYEYLDDGTCLLNGCTVCNYVCSARCFVDRMSVYMQQLTVMQWIRICLTMASLTVY